MWQISNHFYCPFRGCAGDWVKLGVAKRHGAVLGDAICLNSSLPCVLVDVVRCKMGKFSCCVPGCTNNWRNSPEKKFHTLPSDAKVRRLYEKLIRFPDTFAPLQDSHRFNIATVQNSAGLGNSAPGISLSTSWTFVFSSAILETASPKTAPWRFATPNLTQSPAQPRNGQYQSCIITYSGTR